MNVTSLDCSAPWISTVSDGVAVGVTPFTVGVYLAVAGVPFASFASTVAGTGVPAKSLFGVNVTFPVVGSIVYVPTCFPVSSFAGIVVSLVGFPVSGSTNFAGWSASIFIGTLSLPCVNVGVPSCVAPCTPSVATGVPVGTTGVILGVYVVVTAVPFVSLPWIVTGLTSPEYSLFVGVNTAVGFPSTTLSV